jgi:hypothetical protein
MIINVIHKLGKKRNLITIDIRCQQIRYLTNPEKHGPINFYNPGSDADCYRLLYNLPDDSGHRKFLETLAEDVSNNFECIHTEIQPEDLEIRDVVNPE